MATYQSVDREYIVIRGRMYKIKKFMGDLWLLRDCTTDLFYLFDRSESYFLLVQVEYHEPVFLTLDLLFTQRFHHESECTFKGHVFRIFRCSENCNLYVADVIDYSEIKFFARFPAETGEILLDPKNGSIVGVFYEGLDVLHVQDGKFLK